MIPKRTKRPWMVGNKNRLGKGMPFGPCDACKSQRKPLRRQGLCHGCFMSDAMGFTMTRKLQEIMEAKR